MRNNIGLTINLSALAVYFILIVFGVPYYYVFSFTISAQIIGLILQAKGV